MLLLSIALLASGLADDVQREARSLIDAGRFAEAAQKYEVVVKSDPRSSGAWFDLGFCYSQTSRYQDAAAALERHIALSPESADGRTVLGIVYLSQGKTAEARTQLERSLRLDGDQPEAVKALARLESAAGDPARAVTLLRPLSSTPEFDEAARLTLATALSKTGAQRDALNAIEPLLAGPRPPVEAFILAGRARIALNDHTSAALLCERGLAIYPASDRLEAVYFSVPKDVAADRINSRLARLRAEPDSISELIGLGRVLTRAEATSSTDFKGAEALLRQAIKLAPDDATARYTYGRCLHLLGKHGAAIPEFERALKLAADPELRTRIWGQLGEALAESSRPAEARRAFESAVALNRTLPATASEAVFAYVRFLLEEGSDDVDSIVDEILSREPFFLPARLERARRAAARERWQDVIDDAELVARNAIGDAQLQRAGHVLLARAYHVLGRVQEAEAHQAQAQTR